MLNSILKIAIWIYIIVLLALIINGFTQHGTLENNKSKLYSKQQKLQQINNKTVNTLWQLVKTKYFRILRLNLNSQCPLPYMNKLCRSKSCSVCRCDQKQIPLQWIKKDRHQVTDRVKSQQKNLDVWAKERSQGQQQWVWHVQDQENDQGEYFDINQNIQSFSGYNGSYIWSLIYEQNCFKGKNNYQQMCMEQKILYQIISGLHTSISTHLSKYYKDIKNGPMEWADRGDENNFYFNHKQYKIRVLDHPDRVKNLLFLYEILIRSVQTIIPYLQQNHSIVSDQIIQDLQATRLMDQFLAEIKKHNFQSLNQTIPFFFQPKNFHVKQYQRYIHNISRILNCVECEKCKLFGKMQTYGLGTALKILLGYGESYKRNQLVAIFNALNKISISVNTYFNYPKEGKKDIQSQKIQKKNTQKEQDIYVIAKIWGFCGFTLVLFLWVATKWQGQRKVKKMFKNVFPKEPKNTKNQ